MIDDNPIDYESEHNKAINKLVKLRQKYDELEEDKDYVKSLLDVEFEKRIKLQKENEQLKEIKKDLKIILPLLLAIDFKISINECKAINRLCKLVEDDFIKSKELNKVVEKKEYPKRKHITYESVPEAIYNWDD